VICFVVFCVGIWGWLLGGGGGGGGGRGANFVKENFHFNPATHTANAVSKRSTDFASCIND